jgi:hypothetical protein
MSKIRIPVAVAASAIALTFATTSFADDEVTVEADESTAEESTATTTSTTTTAAPTTPTTQPTYVQQQPVQVAQPQPVATTTTTAAPYTPVSSDSSERSIEKRPNRTLLSTGIGIFVVSYGASAVAGAVSDREADKNLFIPVVGPWLDLGDRGCGTEPCGSREDINKAMIVTSGIVQGAGVLMALGSLVIPESTTVTEKRTTAKAAKPEVHVTPLSFRAGAGFGAVGRF